MKTNIILFGCFLVLSPSIFAVSPQDIKPAVLYCTGNTWNVSFGSDEVPTDALVKVSEKKVQLEINLVGFGKTENALKKVSGMVVAGGLTLHPALSNQKPREVWFNLNRYSGEINVSTTSSNEPKVLFVGSCKAASPLF